MPSNILDPRMIDGTKPLSSFDIKTESLSASKIILGDNVILNSGLTSAKIETTQISSVNYFGNTITTDDSAFGQSTIVIANIDSANITTAQVGNATFTGNVISNFTAITTAVSSYVFTDADNSKVFHFDTTTIPEVTATFLLTNINEGFNVGIVNMGLGIVRINSNFTPIINARNPFNSTRYSGMFIYRTNNELFGIGVFE